MVRGFGRRTFMHANMLNAWFVESLLKLNVSKTKELVFDNRKEKKGIFRPVTFIVLINCLSKQ